MQFTLAACLTALVALACAQTPANTAQPPSGNAIGHPELGELIPAGQSYTITWAPDTGDRVTLLLLQGPSSNAVPIRTIAQNIPNTGSYLWPLVPTDLAPAPTGYGIQLIVEGSGAYQFSPQCGVRNDAFTGTTSTSTGADASTSASTTLTLVSASASASTSAAATTSSTSSATSSFTSFATGAATGANFSVPVLSPTLSMSVPPTLLSTFSNTATRSAGTTTAPSASAPAAATGAAVRSLALGAGSASFVLALMGVLGAWAV